MSKPPTDCPTEAFSFQSDDLTLTGAMQRPMETTGRSILLLSGSGPQDRDETIAGKKPFKVLSGSLARAGHTVCRWDDRGVGASEGDYLAASFEVLVEDVASAMRQASRQGGHDRHVLVGHSQGALTAAAAAARYPELVSGLVLLAGMGLPGREALTSQFRRICLAEGWSEDDLEYAQRERGAVFDVLQSGADRIAAGEAREAVETEMSGELIRLLADGADPATLSADEHDSLQPVVDDLLEWEWRFLLKVNPADALSRVSCPVLAVTGANDLQVDAEADLEAIRAASSSAASVDIRVLPDHNHLFQETASGAPSDYASLGQPFSDASVAVITEWLKTG